MNDSNPDTQTGATGQKRIDQLVEDGVDAATIWAAMEGDLV